MKKFRLIVMLTFVCVLLSLAACGEAVYDGEKETQGEDLIVFWADSAELNLPEDETLNAMNVQFHQGEVVHFFSERKTDENNVVLLDIYLCKQDGSKELLASNVSTKYRNGWFLDSEGNYIVVSGKMIARLNQKGEEIYNKTIKDSIRDICQLSDGRIILLLREEGGKMRVAQLDSETGEISKYDIIALEEDVNQFISANNEQLLLLNKSGVWEISLENGQKTNVISFLEYPYELENAVADFRIVGENVVEVLWNERMETLRLVNITQTRTILVMRDQMIGADMRAFVHGFNRENEEYYIVMEELDAGSDVYDFRERTEVELATGSGPDIVGRNSVGNMWEIAEKGILVDLKPYLMQSGIQEEDYFSCVFDVWKKNEAVYGIDVNVNIMGMKVKESFLQGVEDVNIETFVQALLDYQEKAVFKEGWDSKQVLDYLLCGSEDIWGMIDWENRKCDFHKELFLDIMTVAKKYGDSNNNAYPAVADFRTDFSVYVYDYAKQLKAEEMRYIGYFFDEGCYTAANTYSGMGINSNSENLEGAWAFFQYVLREDVQLEYADSDARVINMNKNVFEKIARKEIEEGAIVETVIKGKSTKQIKGSAKVYEELGRDDEAYKAMYDFTEEKMYEIENDLKNIKILPIRTMPILDIIYEEAAAYFAGSKNIEEIIPTIENRVQLYLDEKSK